MSLVDLGACSLVDGLHINNITIIDVVDREEAVAWARRYVEATTLPIEMRPFR